MDLTHYSACDSICDHDGSIWAHGFNSSPFMHDDVTIEASWRPVDIRVGMVAKRTFGDRFEPGELLQVRPFDLTRENVSVLCLRCWAGPKA